MKKVDKAADKLEEKVTNEGPKWIDKVIRNSLIKN